MKRNMIYTTLTALLMLTAASAMCAATAPTAVITTTETWGEAPYEIYFSGYYSTDPDGTIVAYDWDFGDGNTSIEDDGAYTYNVPGNYTISLMVTDNDGETGYDYEGIIIVPGDNPIADSGMKAYVWNSGAEMEWNATTNSIAAILAGQGFEVIQHYAPTPTEIYNTISDPDVKVYWSTGHGSDTSAITGNGVYHATTFGDQVASRGYPITIGIFNHCGDYACYTPGTWLHESTQGNDDVVANRFYGEGWCGDGSGNGGTLTTQSWYTTPIVAYMANGHTYADAVGMVSWAGEEGRKQGNQDLRYPQFCGDVDYDRVVDPEDVTLLQNHISDPTAYPVHSEWDADVNGDGIIDITDVNLLSLHVNNPPEWKLYPRGWFDDDPCVRYETNGTPGIQVDEALNAVADYMDGIITVDTTNAVIACYFA